MSQEVSRLDEGQAILGDPLVPPPAGIVLPIRNGAGFAGGFATIREVFEALVAAYGVPGSGSVAVDQPVLVGAPQEDILGNPRDALPDRGAVERIVPGVGEIIFEDGLEEMR